MKIRLTGTKLGVDDLLEEAIEKINEWAELDFKLLGYKKIDPPRGP